MEQPESKPVFYRHGDLLISSEDLKKLCEDNGLLPVPIKQLETLLNESKKVRAENMEFKNSVVEFIQGVDNINKEYQIEKLAENPMKLLTLIPKLKKKFSKEGSVEREFGMIINPIKRIADLCKLENNLDFLKPKKDAKRLT